jgi:hypothetical protein
MYTHEPSPANPFSQRRRRSYTLVSEDPQKAAPTASPPIPTLPHIDRHATGPIPRQHAYGRNVVEPRVRAVGRRLELPAQHRAAVLAGRQADGLHEDVGAVVGLDVVACVGADRSVRVGEAPVRAEVQHLSWRRRSERGLG